MCNAVWGQNIRKACWLYSKEIFSAVFEAVGKLIVSGSPRNFLWVVKHHSLTIPSLCLCYLEMAVRHLGGLHWWLEWFPNFNHVSCILLSEYSCYCWIEYQLPWPCHCFGLLPLCSHLSGEILLSLNLSREGLLSNLCQSLPHKI